MIFSMISQCISLVKSRANTCETQKIVAKRNSERRTIQDIPNTRQCSRRSRRSMVPEHHMSEKQPTDNNRQHETAYSLRLMD